MTDQGNIFGAVEFYIKGKGIKPILGCEVYVAIGPQEEVRSIKGDINETLVNDRYDEAKRIANNYSGMFGRDKFFFEIQDHGLQQDDMVVPLMKQPSQKTDKDLKKINRSKLDVPEANLIDTSFEYVSRKQGDPVHHAVSGFIQ